MSAPKISVEVVGVAATLPEAPGAGTLKATVSEVMVLEPGASEGVVQEPEASETGSLEVCLSLVVGLPILVPNPQRKRP